MRDQWIMHQRRRVRHSLGVRPAETCWQESARQLRDSRQCWLEHRVLIEGPGERMLEESCWEKILKLFECQVKSLGHFNTEVILVLREADVYVLKVKSNKDIRRIRVTVSTEEIEGGHSHYSRFCHSSFYSAN